MKALLLILCCSLLGAMDDPDQVSVASLAQMMDFRVWTISAHDPMLRGKNGYKVSLYAKNRQGAIGRSYVGTYHDQEPMDIIIQNSGNVYRDVNIYITCPRTYFSDTIVRVSRKSTVNQCHQEELISSQLLFPPIWHEDVLVFYYRPPHPPSKNDGPSIFDPGADSFVGLQFSAPSP